MPLVAVMACWLSMPLKAEPGPIGTWLMNEPVTLWDRGMDALLEAARNTYELKHLPHTISPLARVRIAYPHYRWDDNEINVHFRVEQVLKAEVTHDVCNAIRRTLIGTMLWGVNGGQMIDATTTGIDESVDILVSGWFSHRGFVKVERDDDLGKKLARIIFVEVVLWPFTGDGIECRDRIISLDAPSRPLKRSADYSYGE